MIHSCSKIYSTAAREFLPGLAGMNRKLPNDRRGGKGTTEESNSTKYCRARKCLVISVGTFC